MTKHFMFHLRCISMNKLLYISFFSAYLSMTFLSGSISTSLLLLLVISTTILQVCHYARYFKSVIMLKKSHPISIRNCWPTRRVSYLIHQHVCDLFPHKIPYPSSSVSLASMLPFSLYAKLFDELRSILVLRTAAKFIVYLIWPVLT